MATIGNFASISDKAVVSRFYKATMKKLLTATKEAGKRQKSKSSNSMEVDNSSDEISPSVERAQLFDLAVSLLPGLDPQETDLLFVATEPALKDSDGMIQKKAYKVLSVILKETGNFKLNPRVHDHLVMNRALKLGAQLEKVARIDISLELLFGVVGVAEPV